MSYVLPPPEAPRLPVVGREEFFPLRRVYCVGRNYAAHAREMGGDPDREPPFFFAKPADAAFAAGIDQAAELPYPPDTEDLHHEVELAVALQSGGRGVPEADALSHVFGYAVALDLTRRDRQREAKAKGRPWAMAKGFDHSLPVAPLHPAVDLGHPAAGRIWLTVDGELRQEGDLADLIWRVPEIIALLSRTVALRPGDLILTGTPAGVGPIVVGQRVEAGIAGLGSLAITVRDTLGS